MEGLETVRADDRIIPVLVSLFGIVKRPRNNAVVIASAPDTIIARWVISFK